MVITKLYGGLGNQMYQFAAGEALATKLDTTHYLDTNWFEEIKGNADVVQRVFELDGFAIQPRDISIKDRVRLRLSPPTIFKEGEDYNYHSGFEDLSGNVILDGYWQSFKYFENASDTVRKVFHFPMPSQAENISLIKQIKESESVSIHVRRGDYNTERGKSFHGLLDKTYYDKALADITEYTKKPTLFVFSDEIEWCKANLAFSHPTIFVDSNSPNTGAQDMQLMSSCKHNIIANSSFSWWAAWLNTNPHKRVYAPKNWFKNVEAVKDRIPPKWQLI